MHWDKLAEMKDTFSLHTSHQEKKTQSPGFWSGNIFTRVDKGLSLKAVRASCQSTFGIASRVIDNVVTMQIFFVRFAIEASPEGEQSVVLLRARHRACPAAGKTQLIFDHFFDIDSEKRRSNDGLPWWAFY